MDAQGGGGQVMAVEKVRRGKRHMGLDELRLSSRVPA
jgi:hypothetical protein